MGKSAGRVEQGRIVLGEKKKLLSYYKRRDKIQSSSSNKGRDPARQPGEKNRVGAW